MNWISRLFRRSPRSSEHAQDEQALKELKDSFAKVQMRTDRLENELRRINTELRKSLGQPR